MYTILNDILIMYGILYYKYIYVYRRYYNVHIITTDGIFNL